MNVKGMVSSRYAKQRQIVRMFVTMWCLVSFQPVVGQDYTITKLKLFPDRDEVLIKDVTRDSLGFVWFLTNGEIYRYDGYRSLDILKTIEEQRLMDDMPQRIFADHQNRLWMAGNASLSYLDLKTWRTHEIDTVLLPPVEKRSVRFVEQLSDSTLVIAYENGHILLWKEGHVRILDDLYQMSLATTNTITPECATFWNGCYWISTSAGTLLSVDPDRDYQTRYYPLDSIRQKIFHLVADRDFMYLNVYEEGLYRFEPSGAVSKFQPRDFSVSKTKFHVLKEGKERHVYAEPESVLLLDSALRVTQQLAIPSTHGFRVSTVRIAGDEILLGSDEGIFVVYPKTAGISQLIPDNPGTNKSTRGLYVFPDGGIFYGTYDGAGYVDPDGKTWRFDELRHAYVMLPLNEHTLLIGTEGGFLKVFDRNRMQVSELSYTLSASAGNQNTNNLPYYVMSLAETGTDFLVGSLNGLWLLDKKEWILRPFEDKSGTKHTMGLHIRHIRLTDRHGMLVSTNVGLFQWDDDNWTKIFPKTGNLGVYKSEVVGDTIWVATQGAGLVATDWQGHIIQRLTTENGLSNNLVYSLEWIDGIKVVGTANGLNLVDGRRVRRIGTAEGLSQSEFNSGASFWDAARKRVFIGGLMGYTVLDMTQRWFGSHDQLESCVTEIHTSTRDAAGKSSDYTWPYRGERTLVLKPGQSLTGLYAGTPGNYRTDAKVRYTLNTGDWEQLGPGQFISLIEPSPGDYRIRLETLSTGTEGRRKEFTIVKRPHYYETWWFKGVIVVLVAGLLLLWYRNRIRKIHREQAIRNRIAADLHDEVGSSLTRIFFQVNALSARQHLDDKQDKQLQLIADTSKHALLTMSDMVWSIDSRFDTMKDLVIRMKDYAYRLRDELDFRYRFDEPGEVESGRISQAVRQNLFLIFKEALTNAIKYSDDSEIIIALHVGTTVRLEVTNHYTKKHPAVSDRQGGCGLENMELRAVKVGGKLSVADEDGLFRVTFELLPKRGI